MGFDGSVPGTQLLVRCKNMKNTLMLLPLVLLGLGASNEQPPPVFVAPTPTVAPAAAQTSTNRPPVTGAATAPAKPAPPPSAPAKASSSELEKLAMPIALHPDPLIAIILPASVYPLEIVQAARFVRDTNNIAKLDEQPWDPNVKAVARVPDVISQMDQNIAWTSDLGEAFIDQPKELMDTIQDLRSKAQKAGHL